MADAATPHPVAIAAGNKKVIDAVAPRFIRGDIPSAQRPALTRLLHQAVVLSASYAEVATFMRLSLAKLEGGASDWCVVVTKSLYVQSRTRSQTAGTWHVPALAADIVLGLRGEKNPDRIEQVAKETIESKKFGFTVLVWKSASDKDESIVERVNRLNTLWTSKQGKGTESTPASESSETGKDGQTNEAGSQVAASSSAAPVNPLDGQPPIGCHIQRVLRSNVVVLGRGAPEGSSNASQRYELHGAVSGVLNILGNAQRSVGLNEKCEGQFVKTVHTNLTSTFGHTWHVFVTPLPAHADAHRASACMHAASFDVTPDDLPLVRQEDGKFTTQSSGFGEHTTFQHVGDVRLLEVTMSSFTPAGTELTDSEKQKTPTKYHICVFRSSSLHLQRLSDAATQAAGSGILSRMTSFSSRSIVSALRYVLYGIALAAFLAYIQLAPSSLVSIASGGLVGSPSSTSCARDAHQVPFGPAFLALLASMLPPPLPVMTRVQHLLPPHVVSVLPWLHEGDYAPVDELLDAESLKEHCSPTQTAFDELRGGQAQAMIYIAGLSLALLSLLRIVTRSLERSRVQALVANMTRDRPAVDAILKDTTAAPDNTPSNVRKRK